MCFKLVVIVKVIAFLPLKPRITSEQRYRALCSTLLTWEQLNEEGISLRNEWNQLIEAVSCSLLQSWYNEGMDCRLQVLQTKLEETRSIIDLKCDNLDNLEPHHQPYKNQIETLGGRLEELQRQLNKSIDFANRAGSLDRFKRFLSKNQNFSKDLKLLSEEADCLRKRFSSTIRVPEDSVSSFNMDITEDKNTGTHVEKMSLSKNPINTIISSLPCISLTLPDVGNSKNIYIPLSSAIAIVLFGFGCFVFCFLNCGVSCEDRQPFWTTIEHLFPLRRANSTNQCPTRHAKWPAIIDYTNGLTPF